MKSRANFWPSLLLAFSGSFLLAGYEFIRSPSNTLFKEEFGVDWLPAVLGFMPIVVYLGLRVYARTLTHLKPQKTLLFSHVLFFVLILVAWLLVKMKFSMGSILLYLLRDAYIVLLIEQYWSLYNSFTVLITQKNLMDYLSRSLRSVVFSED